MEIVPTTNGVPAHVHVGETPTGITWNVYVKDGEPEAALALRVKIARTQFDRCYERHMSAVLRVTRLTPHSVSLIMERADAYEEDLKADYESAKFGKTFVEATRRFLDAMSEDLETQADDCGDCAVGGVFKDNVAMQNFAYKSARNSALVCAKRLRLAVGGSKQPRRIKL